jgi:RNA polymerase sigma-70 factor, ECF subfamily
MAMTRTSRMTRQIAEDAPEGAGLGVVFELEPAPSFDAFYRRELPGLLALARALSGSASADDIAQEAMLVAYRHWDTVSTLDVPAAWVRRVCANRCVSTLRRRAVESRALLRLGSRREASPGLSETHEEFWAEVRRLPRRQAQVIALHYIYDLGVAEVASTLGCAEGTVKVHLFRARSVLAERIAQWQGEQQ